jgi:glycerol-3-phosphate dehydrogenase
MNRKPEALTNTPFDILVIGGGILGAAIVYEAAARGFKAAVIEQGDFGQATSANSLKTIHGGLRYLQQADLKRIRQSIRARRKIMAFAPHLVLPQPFLIPVYGHGIKGREAMTVALVINDWLSWDRNRNLPEENVLPKGKVLSRKACLTLLPGIEKKGLTGGALWYDGQVQHSERLILEFILAATERGAVAANYIHTHGFILEKGTVKGIVAEEVFSKTEFLIQAKVVVNASGPWINRVLQSMPQAPQLSLNWVKGINLVISRPLFPDYGVGLQENKKATSGKGARFFFFVPWQGRTMIGTAYNRYLGDPELARLEETEVVEFLNEINTLYPPAHLTLNDVAFAHFGLQPVSEGQNENETHPEPDRHSEIFDHGSLVGVKGLISIKSTKYTTAPVVAEKVLDHIRAQGNLPSGPSSPSEMITHYKKTSLEEDINNFGLKVQVGSAFSLSDHFWQNYGPRSKKFIDFVGPYPDALGIISRDPLVTLGEVLYGIREEMALKLSDIVCRRTNLSQAGCPAQEILEKVAAIMSGELGWDETRRQQEIDLVLKTFPPFRKTV